MNKKEQKKFIIKKIIHIGDLFDNLKIDLSDCDPAGSHIRLNAIAKTFWEIAEILDKEKE